MEMYSWTQWVMFFYIYCFLGWVWESIYVSVREKRLVNRGFLKGPFLPIYGSGALCVLIVTIPFRGNVPLMCVAGMFSAAVLEYVTGAAMEKLFGVRYWDYTDKFLNLNGHICLASVLLWGVMTIMVVDGIQVYLEEFVFWIGEPCLTWIVFGVTPFVTADFATSFVAAIHLRDLLVERERITRELQRLNARTAELTAAVREAGDKATERMLAEVQELMDRVTGEKDRMRLAYNKSIRGLLSRNPRAVSVQYREAFQELKSTFIEKLDEKKELFEEKVESGKEKLESLKRH